VQCEDGSRVRRPSRSRKPSEKMKDVIQAAPAGSAKPGAQRGFHSGKIDPLHSQHIDIMAKWQDAIPDSAFDSAALGSDSAALGSDTCVEFREDAIAISGMLLLPVDMGCDCDVHLTGLEQDFFSHSEEELLGGNVIRVPGTCSDAETAS
jgi:hypothetical protein